MQLPTAFDRLALAFSVGRFHFQEVYYVYMNHLFSHHLLLQLNKLVLCKYYYCPF